MPTPPILEKSIAGKGVQIRGWKRDVSGLTKDVMMRESVVAADDNYDVSIPAYAKFKVSI